MKCSLTSFIALIMLGSSSATEAKLVSLTIGDLLTRSDMVVRAKKTGREVEPIHNGQTTITVIEYLYPTQPVRKSALTVCNDTRSTETVNVSSLRQDAIFFLKFDKTCFRPVHGYLSVYEIVSDRVDTIFILDQPQSQTVSAFKRALRKARLNQRSQGVLTQN